MAARVPVDLPPRHHTCSSSQHLLPGPHHFPSLQPCCNSLQSSNPPTPRHCPRSHQQSAPPPRQSAPPPQQSACPKLQRDHQATQHHSILSKRQQQSLLGVKDEEHKEKNCKRPAPWTRWEAQGNIYQLELAEDPFKHSRSLRHQQPVNPRRKRDEDDEPPDDEDDDSDLDEELANFYREEIAYTELLPKVKQLIKEIGVTDKWTLDREEKTCMVCNFTVHLKGWTALLQHAESFQKRKPAQHRAYFRALTEQLKHGLKTADHINDSHQGKAVLIERGKATEEVMVWPPVVIIENMKENEHLDLYIPNLESLYVQKTVRLSSRGHPGMGRMLVVFPASEVGHLHSKLLIDSLAKLVTPVHNSALHQYPKGRGPPIPPPQHVQHRIMPQQQEHQPPRGVLAQVADMEQMDPQRKLVRWTLEKKREIIKCVLKKSKEEHELGRAKVKAKLVEVDHIAESHQQFKSRKTVLSQQLRDAEMALQLQKEREDQIAKQHAEQLQTMDEKFKEEVQRLEVQRIAREEEIRQLLKSNEKQLDLERVARSKEVEFLVKHLNNVNQELQNQTAQKALDKERVIARKRQKLNGEIKLKEEKFNEEGRILERDLIEKQESEKIKFLEEYNTMRQEFLAEWVTKQAALREKAEKAKQEKEHLMRVAESKESLEELAECSICFADFDNTTRALIQPCGHAKTCLQCAVDIFGHSRLCPICRVKISTKPKAIPIKLYM